MERVSKFRVDDDWINCEMAHLKKRMKFDDSDAVLTTETSVPILFALLEEIKERRGATQTEGVAMERVMKKERLTAEDCEKMFKSGVIKRVDDEILDALIAGDGNIIAGSWIAIIYALCELKVRRKAEKEHGHTDNSASEKDSTGATQEREKAIDEFWMKIELNCTGRPCSKCPASDGDVCGFWEGTCGASLRKKYESIAGANVPPGNDAPEEKPVLPIPCTKGFEDCAVKDYFQKINEELDELKIEVLNVFYSLEIVPHDRLDLPNVWHCRMPKIADEAADTITAITSMLEAMGIDEQQRQEAQRRVNERNKERNRL